jgi:peptide/nickel transport system substrate-binding protein
MGLPRVSKILAAASIAAAATVLATTATGSTRADTTATIRFAFLYQTLDWQTRATTGILGYSFPVYDRLVAFDQAGKKIVPYIATKWSLLPAHRPKTAVFTLRRDAKCSDGTPLTPLVVLNSFKRFIEVPKISNQLPNLFGAGPYHLRADMKKWTFSFKSETPYANMIYGFAMSGIVCPAGLEALKTDPNALQKGMYGSGPYTFVSAVPGDQVVYKKNPAWHWGPPGSNAKTLPDNLIYKIVTDDTTAANLLLTGGVDVASVSGPDVDRLSATSSLTRKTLQNYHPFPLVFNNNPGRATADPAVRQALMTAVSPKDFAQAAWRGRATVTPSILNPSEPCYDKEIAKYAPTGGVAKARQLLQSAGYAPNSSGIMTKDGKPLRLSLVTNPSLNGAGGEYLAGQFKAVGVDVDLRDNTATYSALVVGQNFDVEVSGSFLYAPIQAYNFANYSGPPPPRGTNFGFNGAGDNEYNRTALVALQRTGCTWLVKLQRTILQKHIMLPLGQPLTYTFGTKKWDFPANVQLLEVAYLKPSAQ